MNVAFLLLILAAEPEWRLTGTATRTVQAGLFGRQTIQVYQVESWVLSPKDFADAEALAAEDCPKRITMTMLRPVTGNQAANAFLDVFRQNNGDKFAEERDKLAGWMRNNPTKKGDVVHLDHWPGKGLKISGPSGKLEIDGVEFTSAVWRNWLGKANVGEGVKAGLTRNLKR